MKNRDWFKKQDSQHIRGDIKKKKRHLYYYCSLVFIVSMVKYFLLIDIGTDCHLLTADHMQFSTNHSQYLCCHHIAVLIEKWKEVHNFSTYEETLQNIEEFLFDNTIGSDSITQEMKSYFIESFAASYIYDHPWPAYTPYQKKYQEMFSENFENYKKMYPNIDPSEFACQIQAEHHSLRDADNRIKNYLRNRDIVDIGSFIGDSMLVLQSYTDKNIYCFEINSNNYKILVKNAETVGSKVRPYWMGLGSKEYVAKISNDNGISQMVSEKGDTEVNITTLNKVSKDLGMKVGLIKADVEGMAYDIMLGAKELIARDRPVLTLLVYHCYDEFHGIPQILKEIGGYIFEYRGSNPLEYDLSEGQLFAVPQEVYYPNFYQK